MGTKWSMPLAVIGKPTGDGRQFAAGVLRHRDLPLPLRYVRSDTGGHKEAVVVGRIDTIGEEADGMLPASGVFYDGPEWPEDMRNLATEARMLTGDKVIGPSVDLDEADMEQVPAEPTKLGEVKLAHTKKKGGDGDDCGCSYAVDDAERHINLVTDGRIASATLVHIPAFAELAGRAILTLDGPPVGDQEGESGEFRNFDKGVGGGVDRDKLKASDFGDPAGRKFPIVTAADVADAAHLIGKADNPQAVKKRIIAIAKRKGFPIPDAWKTGNDMDMMTAGADLLAPPAAWFANPNLDGPTPLTITDEGRVFGHVATWDTCHVGIGHQCINPPKSHTGYAYFHTGEVVTAEGQRVSVGRLTYGAGHADRGKGFRAAAEHYDNSANTGALVRAGEDEHGIWVAGALAPDVDERAKFTLRTTPLSGDWRRVGAGLEMVAALHVNTAGFPIPRMLVAGGQMQTMIAAGAVVEANAAQTPSAQMDPAQFGREAAAAFIAEQDAVAARRREFEVLVASVEDDIYREHAADFARECALVERSMTWDSVGTGA